MNRTFLVLLAAIFFTGCSSTPDDQDVETVKEEIGDYGRWCGGDNSGPGDPIDPVDYVCYQHDKCIEKEHTNCKCDFEFRDRMAHLASLLTTKGTMGKFGKDMKITAKMKAYASVAGPAVMTFHKCNCHHKKSILVQRYLVESYRLSLIKKVSHRNVRCQSLPSNRRLDLFIRNSN